MTPMNTEPATRKRRPHPARHHARSAVGVAGIATVAVLTGCMAAGAATGSSATTTAATTADCCDHHALDSRHDCCDNHALDTAATTGARPQQRRRPRCEPRHRPPLPTLRRKAAENQSRSQFASRRTGLAPRHSSPSLGVAGPLFAPWCRSQASRNSAEHPRHLPGSSQIAMRSCTCITPTPKGLVMIGKNMKVGALAFALALGGGVLAGSVLVYRASRRQRRVVRRSWSTTRPRMHRQRPMPRQPLMPRHCRPTRKLRSKATWPHRSPPLPRRRSRTARSIAPKPTTTASTRRT